MVSFLAKLRIIGVLNNHGFNLPRESLCHISPTIFNSKLVKVNFQILRWHEKGERKESLFTFKLASPLLLTNVRLQCRNQN
jgi:hypothetical protein